PGKKSGQTTFAITSDVPCGVHWVRFFDKTGASGLRPFLVNQVPEIQEVEPNDDYRKPQAAASPSVFINGRLGKQDHVDTFAVALSRLRRVPRKSASSCSLPGSRAALGFGSNPTRWCAGASRLRLPLFPSAADYPSREAGRRSLLWPKRMNDCRSASTRASCF